MPEVNHYIQTNGKIVVLLFLCFACIFIVDYRYSFDTFDIFEVSFTTGFFHQTTIYIFSVILWKYTDSRKWHTYIRPNRRYSAGKLAFNIGQFIVLILILPYNSWNVASATLLIASFIAGMCSGKMASILFINLSTKITAPFENKSQLDTERYEAFIATLISTVVLGSSFLQINDQGSVLELNGLLLLPLTFALINAIFTYFFLCIFQNHYRIVKKLSILISILFLILHVYIIQYLIAYFLPENFLLKGVEYEAVQFQTVMLYGLYAGFIAGSFVWVYDLLADWHIAKLLKTDKPSILHNFFRIILNVGIYLLPIACIIYTFWYSIQILGIYGLTLSFLCMLSNIGLKLFIQYDKLDFSNKYHNFTTSQVEHLQAVSPNLKTILSPCIFSKTK